MSTLLEEARFWNAAGRRVRVSTAKVLFQAGAELLRDVRSTSPVDSGRLKSSWRMAKGYTSDGLPSITIKNVQPHAGVLEFGLDKGENPDHPWSRAWANRNSRKGGYPRLTLSGGRLYSSNAPGGIVQPLIRGKYQQKLARSIADAIVKTLKG
jgi:hypothetical protein